MSQLSAKVCRNAGEVRSRLGRRYGHSGRYPPGMAMPEAHEWGRALLYSVTDDFCLT